MVTFKWGSAFRGTEHEEGRELMSKKNMALNPQQQMFKEAYIDPASKTFGNAYRSALLAGYDEEYADTITTRGLDWLSGLVRQKEMVDLAELALRDSLSMDEYDKDRVPALSAIKQKSVQFVLSRLAKDTYAERQEVTGAEGAPLIVSQELTGKYAINTSAIEDRK